MATNISLDVIFQTIEKRQERLQEVEAQRVQLIREIDGLQLSLEIVQQDYGIDLTAPGLQVHPYSDLHDVEKEDIPITHKARNAAYKVLSERRPMHREKLLEGVKALGTDIVGRNPADSLTSYLSPDERFMPVPGLRGFWTLTEEPTGRRAILPTSEGVVDV